MTNRMKVHLFRGLLFLTAFLLVLCGIRPTPEMLYFCIFLSLLAAVWGVVFLFLPMKKWRQEVEEIVRTKTWERFLERKMWESDKMREDIKKIVGGLTEQNLQQKSSEAYEKQAQLLVLQSQINPHFLYNTLDSIRGQALMNDEKDIAAMLEALAAFFRYSINRKDSIVTLWDELKNMENYIKIQNYRFKNRFIIQMDESAEDPEIQKCIVPKLFLQPIVENAVVHGLENRLKGRVTIMVDATEEILLITISDDGTGMSSETLEKITRNLEGELTAKESAKTGHGIALPNVNRRIKTLFGEDYGISIYSTEGKGTDVEILLPRKTENERMRI